jgi:hypothetical protein
MRSNRSPPAASRRYRYQFIFLQTVRPAYLGGYFVAVGIVMPLFIVSRHLYWVLTTPDYPDDPTLPPAGGAHGIGGAGRPVLPALTRPARRTLPGRVVHE